VSSVRSVAKPAMSELITSGSLIDLSPPPVPAQTVAAGAITRFLEQQDKTLNDSVLQWMMEAFKRKVVKQIMSTRDLRKGHDSCSMYSGPCARKSWHQFHGSTGEPIQARSVMKFLMGDTVELDVVGVAVLAGLGLVDNNRDLYITGKDGVKVSVHPDGRLIHQVDEETFVHYNVEVKSADTFSFDGWLANHGPDDKWGYLTQASVEIAAWREAGYHVNETVFIGVSTGSRIGTVAEWIIPYDDKLVQAWHERRALARAEAVPPVPFAAEPDMEYHKGKDCPAVLFLFGEPVPRTNKNGNIYGWDYPNGKMKLPLLCSYCGYKNQCWPSAVIEMKGDKPIWIVPAAKQVGCTDVFLEGQK
jgi:hypothetical protein